MSTIIEINHLYKEYQLGLIGHGTLYKDLQSWWARKRGKEDPNSLLTSGDNIKYEKVSNRILALKDVHLNIKRGERLGIIGKNGAGKTTLLKVLSRITAPSKGRVSIKGRMASLIEIGTGFHPELTGRENVYLNGTILGLKKFEIEQRFDEIVHFSEVEKFIDTPVKRYSSGMYVRLGFSVAAHLDPDILVVDEVLAVGDKDFQQKALGKMKDVNEGEGRTILFVSHNMQAIQNLCTNAILLDKGSIIMRGNSSKVVNKYINDTSSHSVNKFLESAQFKRDIKNVDGSVRFKKFYFLNDRGDPCQEFIKGEKIVLFFEYRVLRYVKSLSFVGSFTLNNINPLAQFSHSVSDTPLESGHEGKIKITIEPDYISSGELFINFFLRGKSKWHNYDYLSSKNLPTLRIIDKNSKIKINQGDIMLELKQFIESY